MLAAPTPAGPCGSKGMDAVLRSPIVVPFENNDALASGDPDDEANEERDARYRAVLVGEGDVDMDIDEADTADPRRRGSNSGMGEVRDDDLDAVDSVRARFCA